VWAVDFTEALPWIDGPYRHLLAARDLASSRQLNSAPSADMMRPALDAFFN